MAAFPSFPTTLFTPDLSSRSSIAATKRANFCSRWHNTFRGLAHLFAISAVGSIGFIKYCTNAQDNRYYINGARLLMALGIFLICSTHLATIVLTPTDPYLLCLEKVAQSVGLIFDSDNYSPKHLDPAYEGELQRLDKIPDLSDNVIDHITLQVFRYPLKITYSREKETFSTTIDFQPALGWLKTKKNLSGRAGETILLNEITTIEFDQSMLQKIKAAIQIHRPPVPKTTRPFQTIDCNVIERARAPSRKRQTLTVVNEG